MCSVFGVFFHKTFIKVDKFVPHSCHIHESCQIHSMFPPRFWPFARPCLPGILLSSAENGSTATPTAATATTAAAPASGNSNLLADIFGGGGGASGSGDLLGGSEGQQSQNASGAGVGGTDLFQEAEEKTQSAKDSIMSLFGGVGASGGESANRKCGLE